MVVVGMFFDHLYRVGFDRPYPAVIIPVAILMLWRNE